MNFKLLYHILPTELADYIAEYHPESRIKMNRVIHELIEYHQKIKEYEAFEFYESLLTDYELIIHSKKQSNHINIPYPYILNPIGYNT